MKTSTSGISVDGGGCKSAAMDILGFDVSPLDFKGNLARITQAALSGRGLWVMTLNLEMATRAATDPDYRRLCRDIDFTIADGMPIVLFSRLGLTAHRIPERSCGVDVTEALLKAFPGRIGILGGRDPRAALHKLHIDPARIAYCFDGKVEPDALEEIVAALKAARVQLLFVALGVPKQDLVCRALRKACPTLVCIGVGGSFEILAGLLGRAPPILRRWGLEWLYRLVSEPRRLARRYLWFYPQVLPSVIAWIKTSHAARRRKPHPADAPAEEHVVPSSGLPKHFL